MLGSGHGRRPNPTADANPSPDPRRDKTRLRRVRVFLQCSALRTATLLTLTASYMYSGISYLPLEYLSYCKSLWVLLVKFEVRMPSKETVRCVSFRSWGSLDCCRRKRPMIDVSDFELGFFRLPARAIESIVVFLREARAMLIRVTFPSVLWGAREKNLILHYIFETRTEEDIQKAR